MTLRLVAGGAARIGQQRFDFGRRLAQAGDVLLQRNLPMDVALCSAYLALHDAGQLLQQDLPQPGEEFSLSLTAEVLEVSPRTVDVDWSMARAWLRRALDA